MSELSESIEADHAAALIEKLAGLETSDELFARSTDYITFLEFREHDTDASDTLDALIVEARKIITDRD